MKEITQIKIENWVKGDYRCFAEIHRTLDDLFKGYNLDFEEFDADGVGEAKMAYLITSGKRQFVVIEYLQTRFPLTNIFILNNSETLTNDLKQILETLDLKFSDLDWIDESIKRNNS